jgi:hypothetical protein
VCFPSLLSTSLSTLRNTHKTPQKNKILSHQLLGHDLAHVDQIKNEPVLLPVHAVDLPRQSGPSLALVALGNDVSHLGLEVLDGVLDLVPARRGPLVLEAAAEGHFCGSGVVEVEGREGRREREAPAIRRFDDSTIPRSLVFFCFCLCFFRYEGQGDDCRYLCERKREQERRAASENGGGKERKSDEVCRQQKKSKEIESLAPL